MDMLATRIKAARKAKGLSQVDLAERVGTDQGHISRIENGAKGASIEVLAAIAQQLDMTVSQLIGDDQRAAEKDSGRGHPAAKILSSKATPAGLRALAADGVLVNALGITKEEWEALGSVKLPGEASKDGYVQLLMTVRGISKT
jgi:transcriptional regulator with XRE-family HTH domain